jgi:signal transduction histidine kinase
VNRVLRTGKAELYPEIPEALLVQSAYDAEHLRLIRELGIRSAMVVPLLAGGRTLGAISFVASESARRYGAEDLDLAQALASRAAQAVDNALLFRQARDAIKVRDDFLYTISHDLKNPLGAIKGYAQLLRGRILKTLPSGAEKILEGLHTIDAAASRMVAQIEELLDLARLQTGQPLELRRAPSDLVAIAKRAVDELGQSQDGSRITLTAEQAKMAGEWDSLRLERVLGNLLSNAVKYSPNGGQITVTLSEQRDQAGRWAVIAVSDHGIGIPAADLPYIFERYRRAENAVGRISGAGVGLASVRQIVDQHGGTVSVVSTEGVGSTFTVRLPFSAEASPGRTDEPFQASMGSLTNEG